MSEEQQFSLVTETMVLEDLSPAVVIKISTTAEFGPPQLVAVMTLSPQEVIYLGHTLIQAGEAATSEAAMVRVMRESKIPEEQILSLINDLRKRRNQWLGRKSI